MRSFLAVALVLLAGCTPLEIGRYDRPSHAGAPPTRQIVANNMPRIFPAAAEPRNIEISDIKPWDEYGLPGWLVCVRARIKSPTSGERTVGTVAVFFQKQEISLRARAEPKHGCENFERLDAMPLKLGP